MSNSILLEILTEELPPKALRDISTSLLNLSLSFLQKDELFFDKPSFKIFATPRRIGFLIRNVSTMAPDKEEKIRLVPKQIGLDNKGRMLPPLENKLRGLLQNNFKIVPLKPDYLETLLKDIYSEELNGKEFLFIDVSNKGISIEESVKKNLASCLKKLPIPKLMKYQKLNPQRIIQDVEFIRPVRGITLMINDKLLDIEIFGVKSSRITSGHRFLGSKAVEIRSALEYESQLFETGKVIAEFEKRRIKVNESIDQICKQENCKAIIDDHLLDEITALCEWPKALLCEFDKEFLSLPDECLILTMQRHQKYIPLAEDDKSLSNKFIVIANNTPEDVTRIKNGNEKVLRARLKDAHFFFQKDKKKYLIERNHDLASVTYHSLLGMLSDRVERIKSLLLDWSTKINLNKSDCITLADVSKNDLVTLMVNEFPELQGTMGKYYYLSEGGKLHIAEAIEDQYKPRYSGDNLPTSKLGKSLALADKFETIAGLISINLLPSGDKDPYAMRRSALGIINILMSERFNTNLSYLIESSLSIFISDREKKEDAIKKMSRFISDRIFFLFKDKGNRPDCIMACMKFCYVDIYHFPHLLKELEKVAIDDDSRDLFLINKRIKNILEKAGVNEEGFDAIDQNLLIDQAEKDLFLISNNLRDQISDQISHNKFDKYLQSCEEFKKPIEIFFENIMVNVDEKAIKNNRIFLLSHVYTIMNQLIDLSLVSKGRNE